MTKPAAKAIRPLPAAATTNAAASISAVATIAEPLRFSDEIEFRQARRLWESLVRCDASLIASHRLVLLHLGTFAGLTAFAFPSAATVARELGVSEKLALRAFAEGRRRGWIRRLRRRGFGGTIEYCLSFHADVADGIQRRLEASR